MNAMDSFSHYSCVSGHEQATQIECGSASAEHFPFAKGYTNLNHGAYGTIPSVVRDTYRQWQDKIDARPDTFTRYEYRPFLLDQSRKAIADFLNVPMETCVFVPNSTTASDTILRNLVYENGDVIIGFATIYDSFQNTVVYLTETTPVLYEKIAYTHPLSDDVLCQLFEAKLAELQSRGKRPRIALFDTVSSLPGLRMPFERLTAICRDHGILSCIDGAHGIGQLQLNLSDLDADFFFSNLHKWLYVPRPCAVLHVPSRNHHLLRSTLPTGFAFVPLTEQPDSANVGSQGRNAFTDNFASTGTLDDSAYLCVQAALDFRSRVNWTERNLKGDEAIISYNLELARNGGQAVANILGTEVLDNAEHTLTRCALTNIRLPLTGKDAGVGAWVQKMLTVKHETAVTVYYYADTWWVRLSAQIYLTMQDFVTAATVLKEVCEAAEEGHWRE